MPLFSALERWHRRAATTAIDLLPWQLPKSGTITAHETTMALLTGTSGTGLKSTQFMTELFGPSSA